MRFDILEEHLKRRQVLGLMAKAGAVGAAVTAGGAPLVAGAAAANGGSVAGGNIAGAAPGGRYDDSFSIEGAKTGEWARETSARYGADDQRGTLNEVTPRKTASALAMLQGARGVETYSLGHTMRNGFPAYPNFPPRRYSQRIFVLGFQPQGDSWFTTPNQNMAGFQEWREADLQRGPLGYLASPTPVGKNEVSSCEERFLHGGTYQIGTQMDHFPHFGVGDILYNGFRASEIATPTGFSKLGMDTVGPFVTRGVLIDVLGWKIAQRGRADVQTVDGHDMLTDTYRITVDDLRETLRWQRVPSLSAGDAILIRTGWWWLAENPKTYDKYLATGPGIYLAEAKYLADFRPALIGSDMWALEVVANPALTEWVFPVHTELLVRRGVHIGEAIVTHTLAERRIYRFVYSYSPQQAYGATAGNAPPMAMVPAR
jgi:kynurenine formamidase